MAVTCISTALGIAAAAVFVAAARGKVVVYFGWADAAVSFLAAILVVLVAAGLVGVVEQGWPQGLEHAMCLLFVGTSGLGVLCLYSTFEQAVKHNRSVALGLLVGVIKVVFVPLIICGIASGLTGGGRKRTLGGALAGILLIALLVWVARVLINGRRVYAAKGWPLPAS